MIEAVTDARHDGARGTLEVVPMRHPLRATATAIVVVLIGVFLWSLCTNKNYEWGVVSRYFTSTAVVTGVIRTLELTVLSMVLGSALGGLLAFMRLSRVLGLRTLATTYTWFFRGVPPLVLLVFLFNISALYPDMSLGLPGGPRWVRIDANSVLTPTIVAVTALSLHEGAYMCEVIRAGILSVDAGQHQAAKALGMRPSLINRRIVLPQAMRAIIPPTGNQVISLLKGTSLVSVIAYPELLYETQSIATRTYQVIPLLLVATIWYLVVVTAMTAAQSALESRFGRGMRSHSGGRPRGPVAGSVGRRSLSARMRRSGLRARTDS